MNNEYNIMKQKIRFKLTDRYLILLICLLGCISTISAQSHKITGVVVDEGKSPINPEKPDVPLNKNDAFQKVQKRRVQEKR